MVRIRSQKTYRTWFWRMKELIFALRSCLSDSQWRANGSQRCLPGVAHVLVDESLYSAKPHLAEIAAKNNPDEFK